MALEYRDFDVRIDRVEGRDYAVSVINSPGGQARGTFTLPFDPSRLEAIRVTVEIALLRSLREVRRTAPREFREVERFGRELCDALFRGDVRSCYDRSSVIAFGEGKGLRLKLRLDPTLAGLPWEFMYSREIRDYVALCRTLPPVRYTELPQPVVPLQITPPLRILVVIASPSGYAPLNVEDEKRRISSALSGLQGRGIVRVEFLEGKDTLSALQARLRQADYHVLHFIGHGAYDEEEEEGVLLMEDAVGRGRLVSGQWLGRLLRGYFPMRLVVLNACEGALTASSDPFSGVGMALVGVGVPAVVAMQFEISDEAAIIFSREFYGALADNYPVDGAVTEARIAIVHSRRNTIEWATPVLYMRAPNGMLFDLQGAGEGGQVEAELARLYTRAERLLAAESWREAIACCEEIAAIDAGYRDVQQLLARARGELARQEREEALALLYDEAMGAIGQRHWQEAIDKLEQVVGWDAHYRDAAAQLAGARQELAEAEAQVRLPFEPETVPIPEGEFIMGSDEGDEDEREPHPARLPAYRIGRYPVTNREYRAFVQDTGHEPPAHWEGGGYPEGVGDHPVVMVSWHDASAYCHWLSERTGRPYRLPSEAEWEKAASWDPETGRKRRYPWGDDFDPNRCNMWEGGLRRTAPVGQYSPAGDSAYGLADMAGNVWEWCSTLYRPYPYDPQDGREDPGASGSRVVRGGSWFSARDNARCAYRVRPVPGNFDDYLGFRVVVAPALS